MYTAGQPSIDANEQTFPSQTVSTSQIAKRHISALSDVANNPSSRSILNDPTRWLIIDAKDRSVRPTPKAVKSIGLPVCRPKKSGTALIDGGPAS